MKIILKDTFEHVKRDTMTFWTKLDGNVLPTLRLFIQENRSLWAIHGAYSNLVTHGIWRRFAYFYYESASVRSPLFALLFDLLCRPSLH